MSNTPATIAKLLAMPMTHVVVTKYADGAERRFEVRSRAAAENHAVGVRRKIGKDLISHGDELGHKAGDVVRVVAVEIEEL